jgi:NAD(P)-dependent dehydrogenase (short-subunit alcohol dehydrogenase family)
MEETGKTLEQVDAEEGAKTLLKRAGKASEVASAILFLASDEASYITGAHFDGRRWLHGNVVLM